MKEGLTIGQLSEINAELHTEIAALKKERDTLAAENAGLKGFGERLSEMRNDLSGTGTGIQGCHEAHIQQVAIEAVIEAFDEIETPATDAAIANIQARSIPEGWKLIPEELHISEEGIELICSQCGNGDEEYGEFVDGVFRVGEVETDDCKKVYGLHVICADYPEEGSVTIATFDNPFRKDHARD